MVTRAGELNALTVTTSSYISSICCIWKTCYSAFNDHFYYECGTVLYFKTSLHCHCKSGHVWSLVLRWADYRGTGLSAKIKNKKNNLQNLHHKDLCLAVCKGEGWWILRKEGPLGSAGHLLGREFHPLLELMPWKNIQITKQSFTGYCGNKDTNILDALKVS